MVELLVNGCLRCGAQRLRRAAYDVLVIGFRVPLEHLVQDLGKLHEAGTSLAAVATRLHHDIGT